MQTEGERAGAGLRVWDVACLFFLFLPGRLQDPGVLCLVGGGDHPAQAQPPTPARVAIHEEGECGKVAPEVTLLFRQALAYWLCENDRSRRSRQTRRRR